MGEPSGTVRVLRATTLLQVAQLQPPASEPWRGSKRSSGNSVPTAEPLPPCTCGHWTKTLPVPDPYREREVVPEPAHSSDRPGNRCPSTHLAGQFWGTGGLWVTLKMSSVLGLHSPLVLLAMSVGGWDPWDDIPHWWA